MKKILTAFILGLFLLSFTSAVCTVTFDDTNYSSGETIVASMSCDSSTEKSKLYNLTWSYSNGTIIESDIETTPASVSESFFETLVTNGISNSTIFANLTGSSLEGSDSAYISSLNSNQLFILDASFSPSAFLGSLFSSDFTITDDGGKMISDATCLIYATDNSDAPLQECGYKKV